MRTLPKAGPLAKQARVAGLLEKASVPASAPCCRLSRNAAPTVLAWSHLADFYHKEQSNGDYRQPGLTVYQVAKISVRT